MQTSFVFNQTKWPGAGDTDDCWVASAIQAANVVAPWLWLPGVPRFRKEAGDPDDGKNDGGNLAEIVKGVEGTWPVMAGRTKRLRGWSWEDFCDVAREHRPLSVSTISSKLPTRLQYGFKGYHQITVVVKYDGTWIVANPLAPVYSRWVKVNPTELKGAIMAYGRDKAGTMGAWAVAFPTEAEMLATFNPLDETPFDQADIDAATAGLRERIEDAVDVLEGVEL